ncbi:translocation/assembly module TamB domain-containing protein [Alcaligenes endophyticus]|uniref:Translocation/assembly module TamB domain-containing protein n=1 Tax=Alcaligenes endophyticus TaxID=1929088 RepID=A0ABT8EGL2_9BURK|nr:translocation/assembly module TamB domain-containing protein [Alcaligenes endophyticus]MCX5589902.1 translocation/assembly module TamB domain-containing protein [Alcaligenes endophyticus]MDN4120435.1 translocation/assembly module TamB domain-containing protein [Alcaligenes endophyticus]
MRFFKAWLRRFLLWGIPFIVLLLLLIAGFVYWVVASQPGTRWALQTALPYAQGSVQGVQGTILKGLQLERLSLSLPDTQINLEGVRLQVAWRELLERRLHVRELSAQRLDVALTTPAEPTVVSEEPFSLPELPVSIAVDKVALGQFSLQQDGQRLPVQVGDLSAAVSLGTAGGQLRLYSLAAGYENIRASLEGDLDLASLQAPFPVQTQLRLQAHATDASAPLCADHYLPTLRAPTKQAVVAADSAPASAALTDDAQALQCALQATLDLTGSLEAAKVNLDAQGQGITLHANAQLTPQALAPLQEAMVSITLPDESGLDAQLHWDVEQQEGMTHDHVRAQFESRHLNIGKLAGNYIELPEALLLGSGELDAQLINREQVQQFSVNLAIQKGSRWNQQDLQGQVQLQASSQAEPGQADWWQSFQLADSVIDLRLGKNQLKLDGGFGQVDSRLSVLAQVPEASAFWPGLELGKLSAQATVQGNIAQHTLKLLADYDLGGAAGEQVGQGPVHAQLQTQGRWSFAQHDKAASWQGSVTVLDIKHAGFGARLESALPIVFKDDSPAPLRSAPDQSVAQPQTSPAVEPWSVQVGAAKVVTFMADKPWVTVQHERSRYQNGQWQTRGGINEMVLSEARLTALEKRLGLQQETEEKKGGIKVRSAEQSKPVEIDLQANWDLAFAGALKGSVDIARVSGDIMIPADPPFPLGLDQLGVRLLAIPTQGGRSRLEAQVNVSTKEMGYIAAKAETLIHATPTGGLALRDQDPKLIEINAHIDDLGWTSLFLGDAMELGGQLDANLRIDVGADWKWTSTGSMNGQNLRFTMLDEGVRLLNGTLQASFDNDIFKLDRLYFPAVLRVEPQEWRTATWVNENPDAKDGGLTVTGQWDLSNQRGQFETDIYRFPILQRADRYAMISGKLTMNLNLPEVMIRGKITADAGWFNLDMLGGIPTLDSDVIVVRGDYKEPDQQPPSVVDLGMEIEVDLGPRFYLTGYGVNSGLVGSLKISMIGGQLTAIGVLRTRGGRIELYGQKLLLRRGMITFQGDITSPILDIEALRTGLPVQAGVKVAGTARRPRIDLVSYPEVDESEKLSWLILGHGSDSGGGDIGLLFSVGTSFLGDAGSEPFYRRFGIDEMTMSSGDLGSVGSILPVETVAPSLEESTSDVERRFVTISKALSSNITLSLQQALSDTGTVGRVSYRLARGLTADLSVGTVNGLALIYRWFSAD